MSDKDEDKDQDEDKDHGGTDQVVPVPWIRDLRQKSDPMTAGTHEPR